MALFDPKRKDSEFREDLSALRHEVRAVVQLSINKEAVLQATNGRAMGAMGVVAPGNHDRRPRKIEPQDGEVLKFTTAATPQSTAWLDQNAVRYKCRHRVVSVHTGKPSRIIVGPEDKISAIFANKEARAAGLSEKVRKARADVDDSGASIRDLSKPIVSNVTAQAVQANMASPRAPLTLEDNDHAPPDQKPASTPTAKMYTYHSGTMPSSNAHLSGKARVNFAQFHGGRVPVLTAEFESR